MRAPLILALVVATGCSTIIGIEDPSPGDDGDDSGPRTLMSIKITPDPLELPLGVQQQLVATGTYSDGSIDDLSPRVTWSLLNGASISLTGGGLVKALAAGDSLVSATFDGIAGQTHAKVGTAAPDHLAFAIGDFNLQQQQLARIKVVLVLTDGTMQDATGTATLTSSDDAIATSPAAGQVAGKTQGTATFTATAFTATPATIRAIVGPTVCHPVINELKTGEPPNLSDNEYVEIYNPCTASINVEGWTLDYRGANTGPGSPDSVLMITLTGTIAPGDILLFAGMGYPGTSDGTWNGAGGILQQNSAAVGLRAGAKDTGPLVDSVAYGNITAAGHPFIETAPGPIMMNGRSLSRLPFDGKDDNDNSADFANLPAGTPRTLNAP